jgi:SPP1 family predicted phage head-tail adaptor
MASKCQLCAKQVGKMNRLLVVEAENPTRDAIGGWADPWASPREVATLWAMMEPLRGQELLRANALEARVSHRITTRYQPGIREEYRLRYDDPLEGVRYFQIRAVINIEEANRFLEISAEEGAPD